jgi:Ni/Co efflux regulator RcnB
MESKQRIVSWAVAAVFAAGLMTQGATAAFAKHKKHHHHQKAQRQRFMHRTVTRQYGAYPNIQYFTQNGHVYARNLDYGTVYLVKW